MACYLLLLVSTKDTSTEKRIEHEPDVASPALRRYQRQSGSPITTLSSRAYRPECFSVKLPSGARSMAPPLLLRAFRGSSLTSLTFFRQIHSLIDAYQNA